MFNMAVSTALANGPARRDRFVCAPSQWERMLQCNIVSHWLGTHKTLHELNTVADDTLPPGVSMSSAAKN